MNRLEKALLGKAFEAEVNQALGKGIGIIQTKSKLAEKLVKSGMLQEVSIQMKGYPPVTVNGYALTILGNMRYCASC